MIDSLESQLRRDEGEELFAYTDSLGYLTIGVGRLIDKRKGGGITAEESTFLLRNDIARKTGDLAKRAPWISELDPVRRAVLENMSFQMGVDGLLQFSNTIGLVRSRQYAAAAAEMLKSKWAQQTPVRATRLAEQMRTGAWQ